MDGNWNRRNFLHLKFVFGNFFAAQSVSQLRHIHAKHTKKNDRKIL